MRYPNKVTRHALLFVVLATVLTMAGLYVFFDTIKTPPLFATYSTMNQTLAQDAPASDRRPAVP